MQLADASWLSPEGVTAILLGITTLLGILSTLLQRAGKVELAQKLDATSDQLGKGAAGIGAVVAAVAEARRSGSLDPVAMQDLLAKIKKTSHDVGVGHLLDAIVQQEKAVPTAGVSAEDDRLRRMNGAVDAAKDVLAPIATPKPTLMQRITGRVA